MAAEGTWRPLAVLMVTAAWGCASLVAPTGGPQDTEPPAVVAASPGAGAVRFAGSRIALEFSEYVDRRSFQESAYLSPSPGTLRFEWSGREVEISFGDTLRPNTTYILTVGTDLRDTHNNRLAESFTLPFSTGERIDSCSASGRVDDQSPGGVMVFAWEVSGGRGDTLDPANARPDYLTQTGADGLFAIRNMKEGTYRIMAVRDVFRNLLYNVQTDAYGMASADFPLGGGVRSAAGIGLRLVSDDTLRPFVSGVRAIDRTSVLIRFNERILPDGAFPDVAIADTATGRPLGLETVAMADTGGRDFVAVTAAQDSGAAYRLSIAGFRDGRGNRADPAGRSGIFSGSADRDTTSPAILSGLPGDSLTGVSPEDTLRLVFSEPVDTARFARGFTLTDAGGAASRGGIRWNGAMIAEFDPPAPYRRGAWYRLAIIGDSLRDRAGNTSRDSLILRRFRIAEARQLSSIAGDVVTGEGKGAAGVPAVVEAVKIPVGGGAYRRARTDSAGAFLLDDLPEGLYLLSAFIDANGNGVHDCGFPFPAKFAEPFGLYTDTLKLRPRWPLEGVRITIGK